MIHFVTLPNEHLFAHALELLARLWSHPAYPVTIGKSLHRVHPALARYAESLIDPAVESRTYAEAFGRERRR